MTEPRIEEERGTACAWCGRPIGRPRAAIGRPRAYCRRSCRQRAYEARRRTSELGLGEHELIVTRAALDDLRDQVFVLRSAVDDARRSMDRIGDTCGTCAGNEPST